MLRRILPYAIWAFYRLLTATWRIREAQPPKLVKKAAPAGHPFIVAFWHGDELSILGLHRRYQVAGMVSTSRDGEMMARCLELLGIKCSRGSSTHGGASALKGMCRLSREGRIPVIAVDGPRGPYHKAKPGIFTLSALLGAEIYPAGVACSRALVFAKTWNKAYLPYPFAKVQVVWGPPIPAVTRHEDPDLDRLSGELERSLNAVRQTAAEMLGAS